MTIDKQDWSVLIVEDEPMLAYALEELVTESGYLIAGVTGSLEGALKIIENGVCDAAILDTNLKGESSGPAALALKARRVPFIVLSGYAHSQQLAAFDGALHFQKPCKSDLLMQALRSILPGS